MKSILLHFVLFVFLFCVSSLSFSQTPNLGTTAVFALFTANGAFGNIGDLTHVTGNVGTNVGAFTAFPTGVAVGQIHVADATSSQAATDVGTANSDLSADACGSVLNTPFGNNQILLPGVYCQGTASFLNGNLTLDGQGNANAIFIIKIGGALSTSTHANITLINEASASNVFWQIDGEFDLGDSSTFRGTVVANGAISLLESSKLLGRGLSIAGAIALHDNVVVTFPDSAGTITGSTIVCQTQSGVNYTVPVITNATGYIWTLPTGASISSGTNTNSISVDYSASAVDGNITVQGSNDCGLGVVSQNYFVTVNPIPQTSAIYHQ